MMPVAIAHHEHIEKAIAQALVPLPPEELLRFFRKKWVERTSEPRPLAMPC